MKTPCQIYEEANSRDACVKYTGEPKQDYFYRLGILMGIHSAFRDPEIDALSELGISDGYRLAGLTM